MISQPLPHSYLSQFLPEYERKNLIRYYTKLAEFKIKEIEEIHKIIYSLDR